MVPLRRTCRCNNPSCCNAASTKNRGKRSLRGAAAKWGPVAHTGTFISKEQMCHTSAMTNRRQVLLFQAALTILSSSRTALLHLLSGTTTHLTLLTWPHLQPTLATLSSSRTALHHLLSSTNTHLTSLARPHLWPALLSLESSCSLAWTAALLHLLSSTITHYNPMAKLVHRRLASLAAACPSIPPVPWT